MPQGTRIALLHTGAVVIPMAGEFVKRELPDVTAINYLDDRIVGDLGDTVRAPSVPGRIAELAQAAVDAGAEVIVLTCSSISELAAGTAERIGVPILRIDEAMADEAVATGDRIAVLATLVTTSGPTTRLIEERAQLAGRNPSITSVVIDGAFAAVSSGDRPTHDRLVAAAIERGAAEADVVVLAQASMATAADAVSVDVPVLTSPRLGVERLAESLATR